MNLLKLLRHNWDRMLAVAFTVVGFVVLLLGWNGAADHVYPAAQIPYLISGGLLGLFFLGLGGTLWLSADLRDEWRKLDDIFATRNQEMANPASGMAGNGAQASVRPPDQRGARGGDVQEPHGEHAKAGA